MSVRKPSELAAILLGCVLVCAGAPASAQNSGCRFLLDSCGPQNPPEPPPRPGGANCGHPHGDYIVIRVKWGDPIGGLAVRAAPNASAERLAVIPATGTGIGVTDCGGSWCKVRYTCINGWSSTSFLSKRTNELRRVVGVSAGDPEGLNLRTGPHYTYSVRASVPYNATDVIVHACQPSPNDHSEWCLVTHNDSSGWVSARFLAR
jgi:uncharacterized protein YraI